MPELKLRVGEAKAFAMDNGDVFFLGWLNRAFPRADWGLSPEAMEDPE